MSGGMEQDAKRHSTRPWMIEDDPLVQAIRSARDQVDYPEHYIKGRRFELTDVIIDWDLSWALGNVLKYIARCGRKGDPIEDLEKALWYLKREIKRLQESACK